MQKKSNASTINQISRLTIAGLAIHFVGFALGYSGEGLVLQGIVGIDTGIARLAPVGDLLYALGLVMVTLSAGRAFVPFKLILVAAIVIGIGFFYKSASHEIHLASGMGFGLAHPQHIGLGAILITLSVAATAVLTLRRRDIIVNER